MRSVAHRTVRLSTGLRTTYLEQVGAQAVPPLLLLHAWGESRRAFVRLLAALPPTMHVIVPDLRGHGDADKPETGYGLRELAADVTALLDLLEVDTVVLIGASSGGYVAQQVAVSDPGRVAGLVLAGSPRTLQGRAPFAEKIDGLTDPVNPDWVRAFTTGFATEANVPDWYTDLLVQDAAQMPAHVWRFALAGLTTSPPPTTQGTITAPTLIISGGRDQLLGREEFQKMASLIRNARWIEYADTGHLVLWEQPQRLAQDITTFLSELSTRG